MKEESRLMQVTLWLSETLRDGPMTADAIKEMAIHDGYSPATLRRAREHLAVESFRRGFGRGGVWHWRLPPAIDVQDEHRRCSKKGGIDDLASIDLDEELLSWNPDEELELQDLHLDEEDLHLDEEDLAVLANIAASAPPPRRRQR
jgi:hypothetical protein